MQLEPGRTAGMIYQAVRNDAAIICHSTLSGDNAVCRGFFDAHKTAPLQIAERLDLIIYIEPEAEK